MKEEAKIVIKDSKGKPLNQAEEIKSARYKIRRNLRSLHEFENKPNEVIELTNNKWQNMELGEGIPFFGKIMTLMKKPPITFEFKYPHDDNQD
jgi:hypothetical protein